jgi:hypothetical protein
VNADGDLTARLGALREVLHNEIAASALLLGARVDSVDAERGILLAGLNERTQAIHDELDGQLGHLQRQVDQRFEASKETLVALKVMLDERYATQTKALDAAFKAAEQAVAVALANAEKATVKAETAADKRFECVESSVRILCSDLAWRPAGDLLPGDELIAFDETGLTRRGRRYRRSVVTANSLAEDVLIRVTTSAGAIRCNPQHPWLARRDSTQKYGRGNWQWVKTEDLRPGDSVHRPLDTWETNRSWESGWLAGMMDGEGCLSLSKANLQLTISQRESPTSDMIASVLKEHLGHEPLSYRVEPGGGTHPHRQPFFHFMVSQRPEVMMILGSTRPPRLLARADGVWEGQVIGSHARTAAVISVEPDGTGMISRLSTSTHTYIGEGFAMHNSVNEFRQTLADQTAAFITRNEVAVRVEALQSAIDRNSGSLGALELRLTSRLDRGEGSDAGTAAFRTERRLDTGQLLQVLVAVIAVAAVVVAVFKG